jgi:hypothetical protein
VTLSAGPTILGIEPYDRDGSKVINVSNPDAGYRPEIAVMRAQALTVYAPFGLQPSTAIAHYPTTTLDNFAISRLRNHVGNKEWVAIFSTLIANPNLQYMATEGQNGVTNGQALPGSRAIGNLTCGDADGDGDHDIVFSMKTSWDLGVLANTPSGTGVPQFNMTSCLTWIWPPEGLGDVTGNVAKPIVADIDNDGDNDCGQTMANSWEMWFDRNQLLSNEELQPKLKLEPDDDPMTEEVGVQIYDAPRRIRFTFELPAPPDDAWPDDYWLDLAIWAQPTDGNMSCDPEAEPPPPPLAARAFYHPPKINLADYAATHIPPDVVGYPQSGYVTVPQPISSSGSGFDQIVYIVAQIVILDDSGALVSAWPGAVYVACAKSTPVDFGDPLTDATDVVAYVQCLLDMQEQTHVEYAVSSNVEPSLITVSQLGQKVGLGGHVPCMPAPVNAPPSKD